MRNNLLLLITFLICQFCFSQNLLDILNEEQIDTTYVSLSFKGNRIGLGHSVETRSKNTFELSIGQRYWNDGEEESSGFIVDQVCTTFALDYAFTDDFTTGASISTLINVSNLFGKYRILRQRNDKKFSFSMTFAQTFTYKLERFELTSTRGSFSDKLAYTSQLLIAHKFDNKFSAQLSPTFIHRGSTRFQVDSPNHVALGISGRYKLTPHFELFSEYFYQFNPLKSRDTFDAFSIGGNWEVSDLLLQFMLTNGRPYAEDLFITSNEFQFNLRNRNLTFGFRATYTFQL